MHFHIRPARADEFARVGRLTVAAYAALPGMPGVDEQPDYYALLLDVARRARNPAIRVFVAVRDDGELVGCVDLIDDMAAYGAGGPAAQPSDAVGVRLLAVAAQSRGHGVGKALTRYCIDVARTLGRSSVVLHTTRAMQTAWGMYERLGFERFAALDFRQGNLDVFGFRLRL